MFPKPGSLLLCIRYSSGFLNQVGDFIKRLSVTWAGGGGGGGWGVAGCWGVAGGWVGVLGVQLRDVRISESLGLWGFLCVCA